MTKNHGKSVFGCACCSGWTRRGFLGALGALGVAAAGARAATDAPRIIDVHHHISPPSWVAALRRARLDSPAVNDWTPQRSIEVMDRGGVATAVTSPTLPAVAFLPPAEAAAIAREANEYARGLAMKYPGRFGAFAMLPMPHVDETLKEIEYALDVLKCDGVAFMTSYEGKYLGDAAFTPVMEELHRRGATAYTHPNDPACCVNLATEVPPVIIEYGTDTTRTIASLIFSGTAARCPGVRFIFSHAGGTVAALTERLTAQVVRFPPFKERGFTTRGVTDQLQRFYYDTARSANPASMAGLTRMVPTSQIVFGTDYPYGTAVDHVRGLREIFDAQDMRRIVRDNALRLMPRLG